MTYSEREREALKAPHGGDTTAAIATNILRSPNAATRHAARLALGRGRRLHRPGHRGPWATWLYPTSPAASNAQREPIPEPPGASFLPSMEPERL